MNDNQIILTKIFRVLVVIAFLLSIILIAIIHKYYTNLLTPNAIGIGAGALFLSYLGFVLLDTIRGTTKDKN